MPLYSYFLPDISAPLSQMRGRGLQRVFVQKVPPSSSVQKTSTSVRQLLPSRLLSLAHKGLFHCFYLTFLNHRVNGLLFPRRYVEQVTSPDILPPDFKNPYLYVPTHLCSQSFCSQLLFPNFFITFIY